MYALDEDGNDTQENLGEKSYGYSTSAWGDLLTSFNGQDITYDNIGNPLTYYNGDEYIFSWTGRRLAGAKKNNKTYLFTYNDEGLRTSKTKNGVTTTYYLNGSRIVAEETSGNLTVYIYDASGSPIGMQYRGANYSAGAWDIYWYEKNLQGDIVAVYGADGTKLVSYVYDAWGNQTVTFLNGGENTAAVNNPFRYRGYYYDNDLGLYYLNSRYYDAKIGRFINIDSLMSGTNGYLQGFNLYAYCFNNPVNLIDGNGNWPEWIENAANWTKDNIVQPILDFANEAIDYFTLPSQEEHFDRNLNNIQFPEKYDKTFFEGWNDEVSANCHQFSAPERDNKKYVSPDGKYEAIYDADENLVTDIRDVGTYNFVSPKEDGLGHFIKDVLPWFRHGNSPDDPTKWWKRIFSFVGIYV